VANNEEMVVVSWFSGSASSLCTNGCGRQNVESALFRYDGSFAGESSAGIDVARRVFCLIYMRNNLKLLSYETINMFFFVLRKFRVHSELPTTNMNFSEIDTTED
jgi:hypothetical protein